MNKLTIIGNLTRDPELRTTKTGVNVCTFTVAVNKKDGDADFFRVTAWRGLADTCAKFLQRGKKVCVVGPVGVSTYQAQDGATRASLEVTADDVEFLSPRVSDLPPEVPDKYAQQEMPIAGSKGGFTQVETDELPF